VGIVNRVIPKYFKLGNRGYRLQRREAGSRVRLYPGGNPIAALQLNAGARGCPCEYMKYPYGFSFGKTERCFVSQK